MFPSGPPVTHAVIQPLTAFALTRYILGTLVYLTILTSFIADWQGISFEKSKFRYFGTLSISNATITRDVERGVLTRSLWAWSRHPRSLCEQVFWIIIHLFPLLSPNSPKFNFPLTSLIPLIQLLPCLLFCLLSFFSMWRTEVVLKVKCRTYAAYQESVVMFVPLLTPGARLNRQGRQEAIEAPVGTRLNTDEKGTQDVLVNGQDEYSSIPPAIFGVSKAE